MSDVSNPNDFQRQASTQGREFEEAVGFLLKAQGWSIIGVRVRPSPDHPEIDIVAEHPDGELWWIECKGSYRPPTPGLIRADTLKKAIAVADDVLILRSEMSADGDTPIPYMLVTSHFPKAHTLGAAMLARALEREVFTTVVNLAFEEWVPDE